MTYIVGLDRPVVLGDEGARLLAESLREMAERHEGYANTIGLTREQRQAIRDNASIARVKAGKLAQRARMDSGLAERMV